MRQLQESITVLTRMESRHEAPLQDHREWLESLQREDELERLARAERWKARDAEMASNKLRMAEEREPQDQSMALHNQRMARLEELLSRMGEKLDAMKRFTGRQSQQSSLAS